MVMRTLRMAIVALSLIICSTAFSATMAGYSALCAIVNPQTWGLDNLITSVLAAAGVFIVGWFTKPPKRKNK